MVESVRTLVQRNDQELLTNVVTVQLKLASSPGVGRSFSELGMFLGIPWVMLSFHPP